MLSQLPIDLSKVSGENIDKQIARAGILAEYDAVSFYEQMATKATDPKLKKVLMDIAKEEKTHVGEFQAMLLTWDKEQVKEMEAGKEEVEEM